MATRQRRGNQWNWTLETDMRLVMALVVGALLMMGGSGAMNTAWAGERAGEVQWTLERGGSDTESRGTVEPVHYRGHRSQSDRHDRRAERGVYRSHLRGLSAAQAQQLARWDGHTMILSGVDELSAAAASALSHWRGEVLVLDGVRELSAAAASALSHWGGEVLVLDGVAHLSAATASSLSHWGGEVLELNGVRELSAASASALSHWPGDVLSLRGLRELSAAAQSALSHWRGSTLLLGRGHQGRQKPHRTRW